MISYQFHTFSLQLLCCALLISAFVLNSCLLHHKSLWHTSHQHISTPLKPTTRPRRRAKMTSTRVEQSSQSVLCGKAPERSSTSTLPPNYEAGDFAKIRALSVASSNSHASLPDYQDAVQLAEASSSSSSPKFYPTKTFQIQNAGHPLFALPSPPKPIPIPVFEVDASGEVGNLIYESLRHTRGSGNCMLIRAGDSFEEPLSRTVYRFGPGKPPRLQLSGTVACNEEFEVVNKGLTTRAQVIRTHLGTFQWRYASRQERQEANADSLLVFEQITTVVLLGGKKEEQRRRVAHLVRNNEFRTEGTRGCTAGNGGRLMMDLRGWMGTKGDAEQMEVLVITGCLVMLKKEIDRRRVHQAVVIMGGASGGGP